MKYVMVRFIGRGAPRIDNVRHTNRVWPHEGSILRIPDNEAESYLAFSGVWERASINSVESEDVEKLNSDANVELAAGIIGMMNRKNIRTIAEACLVFLDEAGDDASDLKESLKLKRKAA